MAAIEGTHYICGYLNALQSAIENLTVGKGEAWLYVISNFKSRSIAGQGLRESSVICLCTRARIVYMHRGRISQICIPQCKCNDGRPATNARNMQKMRAGRSCCYSLWKCSVKKCAIFACHAHRFGNDRNRLNRISLLETYLTNMCIFANVNSRWIMFLFF